MNRGNRMGKGGQMGIMQRCKSCGVPRGAAKNHRWLSNGTIVFAHDRSHRMVFLESDNLDGLFSNLEKMLELPIEPLVIEAKGKATRDFLHFLVRRRTGWVVYLLSYLPVRKFITDMSRVMGYGKVDLREVSPRFKRAERMTLRVSDTYSLPLICGDFKGAADLVERRTSSVDYLMEKDGSYLITAFRTSDELVPQEESPVKYESRPGDIEWDRCHVCGTPLAVGEFDWDLERGIITDPLSGRRMAIYGPAGVDRVFYDLERELGRPVDELVIEAQRRHAHTFLGKKESVQGYSSLRKMLAVRGMGNLVNMEGGREGLELRIENPCLTPILVGMLCAAYEIATDRRIEPIWEKTPDGDLLLQLSPAE
jgi:hypothetical protein